MAEIKATRGSDRITIKDVATDAGVSVAAVSKVLRDAYGVSDSLRSRVRASMDKLNYRPLASARGMRGQTYTLGLILPDIRNPFFSDILAGINTALERTPYRLMLGISQSTTHIEEGLLDSMIDSQMDGLILIGTAEDQGRLEATAAIKPMVAIGHFAPQSGGYDTVNNDDQLSAQLVVRHLVGNGYRHIAMLSLASHTRRAWSSNRSGTLPSVA